MNANFRQYADTLDYLEVFKVTISPKGEYKIPSEKDGRIALVDPDERARLRQFLLEFCLRMECGPIPELEAMELRTLLSNLSGKLECPNPEHAAEPKRKGRAA